MQVRGHLICDIKTRTPAVMKRKRQVTQEQYWKSLVQSPSERCTLQPLVDAMTMLWLRSLEILRVSNGKYCAAMIERTIHARALIHTRSARLMICPLRISTAVTLIVVDDGVPHLRSNTSDSGRVLVLLDFCTRCLERHGSLVEALLNASGQFFKRMR